MLTAGYDVGGAHLKVALVDGGRVVDVRQIACPLWQGLDRLDVALADAADVTSRATRHAVTMTAELTEIFPSRRAGVDALVGYMAERLPSDARFYMGLKGFGGAAAAREHPELAASTNFLATAQSIAARRPKALLIDMGSTTTDIVVCDRPQGLTDAERLQTGELVYTGLTRTPVPSVVTSAPLAGQWQGLARDVFATMADVRRVLGQLPDGVDTHATTDGRGRSVEESLARLARGFGRDGDVRQLATWRASAAHIREQQLRSIHDGAIQVLSRPGAGVTSVIAAGIGADEVDEIARRLALPCKSYGDLIGAEASCRDWAMRCAPAVAVALLAASA
ncbi:MAG: hydantoinase/oxoprolinase family protein [Hyphomicrobium sp.]